MALNDHPPIRVVLQHCSLIFEGGAGIRAELIGIESKMDRLFDILNECILGLFRLLHLFGLTLLSCQAVLFNLTFLQSSAPSLTLLFRLPISGFTWSRLLQSPFRRYRADLLLGTAGSQNQKTGTNQAHDHTHQHFFHSCLLMVPWCFVNDRHSFNPGPPDSMPEQ